MDEQRIEVSDCPLLPVIRGQGIMPGIGLVEGRVEGAKEGGHGEIDAAVAIVAGGVDEDGPTPIVAEEIAGPKIAMEERRRLGRENCRKLLVEPVELAAGRGWKETVLRCELDLGLETAVYEKVGPARSWGVILGKRPHIVVVIETEKTRRAWLMARVRGDGGR